MTVTLSIEYGAILMKMHVVNSMVMNTAINRKTLVNIFLQRSEKCASGKKPGQRGSSSEAVAIKPQPRAIQVGSLKLVSNLLFAIFKTADYQMNWEIRGILFHSLQKLMSRVFELLVPEEKFDLNVVLLNLFVMFFPLIISYQGRHHVKSQNCFVNILLNLLKELIRK